VKRVQIFREVAQIMRKEKFGLAALISFEDGKTRH
jgi:hypothetical protein